MTHQEVGAMLIKASIEPQPAKVSWDGTPSANLNEEKSMVGFFSSSM